MGTFIRYFEYKAESAGGQVISVSSWNTSRACSGCGRLKEDLTVSERAKACSQRGIRIDRDLYAAQNILNLDCPSVKEEHFAVGFEGVDKRMDGGLLR